MLGLHHFTSGNFARGKEIISKLKSGTLLYHVVKGHCGTKCMHQVPKLAVSERCLSFFFLLTNFPFVYAAKW